LQMGAEIGRRNDPSLSPNVTHPFVRRALIRLYGDKLTPEQMERVVQTFEPSKGATVTGVKQAYKIDEQQQKNGKTDEPKATDPLGGGNKPPAQPPAPPATPDPPPNPKKIPNDIIRRIGGEPTIKWIKKNSLEEFRGGRNPDLYWDSKTGQIYLQKPGGGWIRTEFNVNDFLSG